MKKGAFLAMLFLLTGCPGPGDRMVPRTPTTVSINDNRICAISLMKPDEKMTAFEIYNRIHEPVLLRFPDKPLYIRQGQCLPLFDMTFQPGTEYVISWDIQTASGMQMITARFTLAADAQGNLSLAP